MFNFGGVTHVIKNPAGSYSLVGAVNSDMMTRRKPTMSDIFGGRVQPDGFAYVGKPYQSVDEIKVDAEKCGAKLCTSATCACRSIF